MVVHSHTNNLKNWFLTASALPQYFCLHSRFASRQWSLIISSSSSCLCIPKQVEKLVSDLSESSRDLTSEIDPILQYRVDFRRSNPEALAKPESQLFNLFGYILVIFLLFFIPLSAEPVVVTAQVEGKIYEGMPIKGNITVTHNEALQIPSDSFLLDGKPLKVVYEKDVKLDPHSQLVISIYHFTLEPQSLGLHQLPEISVIVGGNVYRSIASTYEVGESASAPKKPTPASSSGALLKIEPLLEGKSTLYPGQRIKIGYRYIYNYSVDLTHEEIPLLEAKGFRKIGEKEFNNYVKGKLIYLDATQVIEAVKPGEYLFPPAKIQGRAYKVNRFGQKTYMQTDSFAESPAMTLKVLPFPDKGKPASFNGAIGSSLTFEMKLLSSDSVAVGDKMELLITIQGMGELATTPSPEVCCQPGFSGFFRLSDLPPIETLVGAIKTFKVEMRPLSEKIHEIPVLEFSYFNPETQSYTVLQSGPIPIKVAPLPLSSPSTPPAEEKGEGGFSPEEENAPVPSAIEIEGNIPLKPSDLNHLWWGSWYVFLGIPFGIGILLLQIQLHRFLKEQKQSPPPKKSDELFQEALTHSPENSLFFELLERAFILKLVEQKEIVDPEMASELLPTTGTSGEVRAFLKEVERKRFSGKEGEFGPDFISQAKTVFYGEKG